MKRALLSLVLISLSLNLKAQLCGTPGLDGSGNISQSINTYFPVSGEVTLSAGAKTLQLAVVPPNDAYGNNFGIKPVSAGDMLLIIQMQDATISSANDNSYGSNSSVSGSDNLGGTGFTSLGGTGVFEYVIATNAVPLTGGTLTFKGAGPGKGIVNSYFNAAATATRGKRTFQVVRIPQYSNLILSSAIYTPPFNGSAGGIIAFDVAGTMDFNGYTIDASSKGFRGGYGPVAASGDNITSVYVIPSSDTRSVGKGEGIAGTPRFMWDGFNHVDNGIEGLPGGSYGRGAPGNAGGGGNDHNAGGGGGGNGGFGGTGGNGAPCCGTGYPNGGRPGSVTYTSLSPDISRIIMGGGGGGGDANNALNGVKGGVGGGIVLVNAGRITGNGTILANGGKGAPGAQGSRPDGAGGGGAGGTVYIKVTNPDPAATLTIEAKGGDGGNTENDLPGNEHGPGGGGGGGQIFYAVSSGTVNISTSKGFAGKTNSGLGTNHGATNGTDGNSIPYLITDLPAHLQGGGAGCYPNVTTAVNVIDPLGIKVPGMEIEYVVKATNYPGGGNAGGAQIEVQLSAGISFKSATVSYVGDSGGPITISNLGTTARPLFGDFNIAPGGDVIVTVKAVIDCEATPQIYHASAQTLYLDPSRTVADPNRRITSQTNAFPGSNVNYETGSLGFVPGSNFSGSGSVSDDVTVTTAGPLSSNIISIAGDPVKLCVSTIGDLADPAVISGSTPTGDIGIYTYQWQSSTDNKNFTDIAAAVSKDFDPQPVSITTFYRRIVTSSPCTNPLTSNVIKVVIAVLPVADFEMPDFCLSDGIAIFTNKSSIADGSESQLTYLWDFGEPSSGTLNTSTSINGAHSYNSQGTYVVTLTVTSKDGCSTLKSHSFTVNGSVPKAAFRVRNLTALCSSVPVEFEDISTVDFGEITKIEWYYDFANNPALLEVDNSPGLRTAPKVYTHLYPTTTSPVNVYEVRMRAFSGASCVHETSELISVNTMPEVTFTPLPTVCINDLAFQITQATELTGIGGTAVYSGNGVSSSGIFDPAIAGIGTHTITYTSTSATGGCSDSESRDIIVQSNPVVSNRNADILLGGEVIMPIIAAQDGLDYQWSPAVSLSATNILTPVASPEETTTYTLTVTDKLTGCTGTGTIIVTVNKVPEIPNTFTPNGDGINDFWIIENLSTYSNCIVNVYNRNGVQVFRSIGYNSPWDGSYQGNSLPAGTYYYVIDPKKGRKKISGPITILK